MRIISTPTCQRQSEFFADENCRGASYELRGATLCKRVHKMVVYISAIIKPSELALPSDPRY